MGVTLNEMMGLVQLGACGTRGLWWDLGWCRLWHKVYTFLDYWAPTDGV